MYPAGARQGARNSREGEVDALLARKNPTAVQQEDIVFSPGGRVQLRRASPRGGGSSGGKSELEVEREMAFAKISELEHIMNGELREERMGCCTRYFRAANLLPKDGPRPLRKGTSTATEI